MAAEALEDRALGAAEVPLELGHGRVEVPALQQVQQVLVRRRLVGGVAPDPVHLRECEAELGGERAAMATSRATR